MDGKGDTMDNHQPANRDYVPECPFHAGDRVRFIGPSKVHEGKNIGYLLQPEKGTKGVVILPPDDGLVRSSHGDRPFFVWVDFGIPYRRHFMLSDELEAI